MTESRFDFAFVPSRRVSETVALAKLGENLGYRCVWIPDQGFHRDPFAILGLVAHDTSIIRIGVGITSPFTRLPVQIARAAATVDEMSEGRFRLGLGTANVVHVVRPLGVRYEDPVGRLRDSMRIIRQLLRGETVTFDGPHDRLSAVQLEFQARHDIEIYVGTRGPRMLEMCGAEADGVLVESLFNCLPPVLDRISRGADQKRRSAADVDLVAWQLVWATDDPDPVIQAHKPWIARSIQIGPPEVMHRIGIDEEVVARVNAAMERGDVEEATAAVPDEAVQCLMLIDRPSELVRRFGEIFESGATSVGVVGIGDYEEFSATLKSLAHNVLPAFS